MKEHWCKNKTLERLINKGVICNNCGKHGRFTRILIVWDEGKVKKKCL